MAPWQGRLLSPVSRSELTVPGTSQVLPPPSRAPSRISEADLMVQSYSIPSLQPSTHNARETSSSSKTSRPSSHGRSMSHPFPSFFSLRKKRSADHVGAGIESSDEELPTSIIEKRPQIHSQAHRTKVSDEHLISGKCMTCDTVVRWPKGLLLFRCAVCLTINDLKPVRLEIRRDGQRAPVATKTGSISWSDSPEKVQLSTEKTRHLIDKCINTYISYRLEHHEKHLPPRDSPSGSPLIAGKKSEGSVSQQECRGGSFTCTPPIHLSGRPRNSPDGYLGSGYHSSQRPKSRPYSLSSPVDYFQGVLEDGKNGKLPIQSRGGLDDKANDAEASAQEFVEEHSEASNRFQQASIVKSIFRPLEDYVVTCFGSLECVNASFSTHRPSKSSRTMSEGNRRATTTTFREILNYDNNMSEVDAKTLLIGDIAENGSWWIGNNADVKRSDRSRNVRDAMMNGSDLTTIKSARIEWSDLNDWYRLVLYPGRLWRRNLDDLLVAESKMPLQTLSPQETVEIEEEILEAEAHCQRVLLKATEGLLKRPGRRVSDPDDLRFLLILLANPLLYSSNTTGLPQYRSRSRSTSRGPQPSPRKEDGLRIPKESLGRVSPTATTPTRSNAGQHSMIIKRLLGLLSNVPNECHHHLVSWFASFSDIHFQRTTDLIGSFVTYRLTRQRPRKREINQDPTIDLVPTTSGVGRNTSAVLHAALGVGPKPSRKPEHKKETVVYDDDWQIKAAARVMALLFAANNMTSGRNYDTTRFPVALNRAHNAGLAGRRAHAHGQILPTSDFYNSLLDCSDLIADFEAWESRRGKFAFCQFPFFLSIWAKIQILEHDARRQMELKAREAFFDSIMTRKLVYQHLVLKIRRQCLVEDSLRSVSEVVGAGGEELKKGLRIEFAGEEGVDAGGLRKEWFLLLVRDVFNPEHGMFIYDEDSQYCYFNPNSFETTDQFFLVGVVLGLAIYNSTILDVAFPPFAFRKLLAAGPTAAPGAASHAKPLMTYSLEDLAEFRPALANGLQKLLEFEGDVEKTFYRDFVADVDRYGQLVQVPLCPGGDKKPVTNDNRSEFVDLYVRYLLETAVTRQFEPFKRGFFTVCGGNALSLFRPEEIELLIRGSDEALDIPSLRAVSICDGWKNLGPAETELVMDWFWGSFQNAIPKDQRKLLSFITGSDRIPGMGAASLVIRVVYLGSDTARFPQARTCFNQIALAPYESRERLEMMLWRAVSDSEGFGRK